MTTLTSGADAQERPRSDISSLVDAWLLLRDIETGGERNRGIYILKARGIAHSNQIREFLLTNHGVELRDVYLGEAGLLTGSARVTQEAKDASAALAGPAGNRTKAAPARAQAQGAGRSDRGAPARIGDRGTGIAAAHRARRAEISKCGTGPR